MSGNPRELGRDVQDGKVTSFPMAVKKKDDETVVFSWMEWPDKETCGRGWEAMMKDPRMEKMNDTPWLPRALTCGRHGRPALPTR